MGAEGTVICQPDSLWLAPIARVAGAFGRGARRCPVAVLQECTPPGFLQAPLALGTHIGPSQQRFNPELPLPEVCVKEEVAGWMESVAALESEGTNARAAGNERAAEGCFREALGIALNAVSLAQASPRAGSQDALRFSARLALTLGEVSRARELIEIAIGSDAIAVDVEAWAQLRDVSAWPDAWLIAAVRRDPPDTPALDALAERYWRGLFGRCYLLTLDREKAADLAQQAWYRLLRARQRLNPGGNFGGYLATVAMNLWRDSHRSARRAGPMSDDRLASLDEPLSLEGDETVALSDVLPDLSSLQAEQQSLLKVDLDRALGRLTPESRAVLVARFIMGESCAEIASRHGRTEQTVSGWVREAIREIRLHLEEPSELSTRSEEP